MTAKPRNVSPLLILGLACGLVFGPAFGEAAKPPQKPAPAKPKVIDLDFTDDDGETAAPRSPARTGGNARSGQWIYWTLGASVLAGGVGWYFLEERQKDPIVTRNEQVFTDERP
jgi:hypothetical protein